MIIFYDTCSLLSELKNAFQTEEKFYLSDITLNELEEIKTSGRKDEETKYNARLLLHLLEENVDKYEICLHTLEAEEELKNLNLPITNDSRIISDALSLYKKLKMPDDFIFATQDLACKALANAHGLPVWCSKYKYQDEYTGFKEITLNDTDLAEWYQTILINNDNKFNLFENQY